MDKRGGLNAFSIVAVGMTSSTQLAATITLSLVSCGCASGGATPTQAASADPVAFFIGRTHGDADLKKLFSAKTRISVEGVGQELNGTLVLDQITREGTDAPKTRRWVMRKVAPGRYTGSLTDASGPVTIQVRGNLASVRYPMKGGLSVAQQLVVQSDGRTMLNQLNVSKFGIRVATLRETIHKLD